MVLHWGLHRCASAEINPLKIAPAIAPTGQSGLFSSIIDLTQPAVTSVPSLMICLLSGEH